MDRKVRKWSQSSGPGQTGPRGASPDETSSSSEDPISRLTAIATTLSSELVPPPTVPQPRSAAQTTPVQIKPEPMDLDDKPSCRFARKGEGVILTLPGPSGEGATSEWQPNMKNTDVVSTKLPSYEEAKLHNTRRPLSTPPSYPLSDRRHRSPTSGFPSPFTFSRHPMSPSADGSRHTRSVSVASSTATLTSGSSLQGGEQQQSLQQDRQQLLRPERFLQSGASAAEAGARRQQRDYQQQALLFMTKRFRHLGIGKDILGRGQEAGATQSQHNVFHQQRLDQQRESQSVHRSGQSREHATEVGSGNQVGQQEMTSQGSNTRISGGPATVTSGQSQVQSQQVHGFFKHPPIRLRSSPSGTSPLSGMFGLQTALQHGGAVRSDTTIRQLLQSRTNPPYPNLGTPVHQLHHHQQRYVQQQHHHHHQQQQEHQRHPQQFHKPLSLRLSDGSACVKPVTVVQRRYSAPPHTNDVVMKEEIGEQFSTPSGATAQLIEGTRAMESTGPEGLEPPSFPQKDLNQNIPTTSNSMYSTGEICVVPPTPINDPDAIRLEEISMGSTLLDLDGIQQQQRQARYDGPSPSPSFSGGYGLPPSPDMQGSFYPEQVHFFQAQQMGPTIQQAGGDQMSEIDENEMMRLLMREMIPDILADCHKLNLVPNLYYWSPEDVQKWLQCVISRFDLEAIEMGNFYFDGTTLASLQDSDFRQRAPKCGDILYSVVCLLKTTIHFDPAPQVVPQSQMVHHLPQPSQFHTGAPTTDMVMPARYVGTPVSPGAKPGDESGSTGSPSDDEISLPSPPAPSGPNTSMTPNHTGGIQLWQFLKELLLQPNSYSYCIRWMDRTQGIFKIEDSVEVARLWGLRKNRPAMNYDKLSRSIRQYYRKGIMKKTEVSQRLVYQFVHPC